ncbi:MAG: isopeptide-forming domain-containing fimbrial protein [Desulfobacterales bacterium]|nr:isopeptide-forming domain-containing fimbrial protein [Desulfobacterales bacterium]
MKKRFLFSFLSVLLLLWLVPQVMAVGTVAGTSISNQAYVDYKDANSNPLTRVYSNTVTTMVSQVYGVSLGPISQTQTAGIASEASFLIQLFNTGNGSDTQTYTYTLDGGSTFTPSYVKIYYDQNNNHILDLGTDPLIDNNATPGAGGGPFTTTISIAHDDDYDIFMLVGTTGAADTQQAIINLSTVSVGEATKTASGSYTTIISTAVVTSAKTHTPEAPKPGQDVTYTITLTNSGSSDALSAKLTDLIPTGMTYKTGTITVGGVLKTDTGADGDGVDFNSTVAGAVYVNVGTVKGKTNNPPDGETVTITFQATVKASIAAGTAITNQAAIEYTVGATTLNATSNGRTLFVASAPAVAVTPVATSATGDPGTKITYPITISNNGNAADVIDVSYTSTAGWTWALWYDANNDGIAGNDGDYLLTDTDDDGVDDTGSIAQGGTVKILAVVTIPAGTSNATVDTLVVKGTSSNDTAVYATSGNLTTTVTAPVLAITKAVSPTGNQPPGTILTYTVTVTNNGLGVATSVIITDIIPQYTTYQANTIRTGSSSGTLASNTDAAGDDGAQFDSGSNAIIAGGTSKTLGAGGQFILEFQVKID